jgi:AcrR family transcriptional regulator
VEEKVLRILEEVRRLYHRYGIKSVTMDDVSSHLGISKKTLYEFFKDKEDLVRQVLLLKQERVKQQFKEIAGKNLNAIEELFEVYRILNDLFREYNPSMEYDIRKYYPDICSWDREEHRKRKYATAYNNMLKGKREGLYRKDLDASVIARLLVSHAESMISSDLFSQEELTSFKVFQEIFVYSLQGIMSNKGRGFFDTNFEKIKASLK